MKQIMDLFLTFGRIGAFTFGGGYAMLSLLNYECVESGSQKMNWWMENGNLFLQFVGTEQYKVYKIEDGKIAKTRNTVV